MSDLSASFQINVSLPGLIPALPLRAAPVVLSDTAPVTVNFGAALVGLLTPATPEGSETERQAAATGGKILPDEDDELAPDALIAWMPGETLAVAALPPAEPQPQLTATAAATALPPALERGMAERATPPAPEAATAPAGDAKVAPLAMPVPVPSPVPARPDQAAPAAPAQASATPLATGDAPSADPARPGADVKPASSSGAAAPLPMAAQVPLAAATQTVIPAATLPPITAAGASPMPAQATIAAQHAVPHAVSPQLPANDAMPPQMEGAAPQVGELAVPAMADDLPAARRRFEVAPARDTVQANTVPAVVTLQPAAAAPAGLTSGAAAQVFATALTSVFPEAATDRVHEATVLLGAMSQAEQRLTVQPLSGTAQPALDMSRDDWTGQMIERIAALRDSAEAADTRIKLAPENLGALEVSIRRDGDRIHVHFTADNPAARQLIADAAPRLAELADARGLKLGQASVDGGNAGGSQQGPQRDSQPQSRATARQPSAASRSEPAGDDRIA